MYVSAAVAVYDPLSAVVTPATTMDAVAIGVGMNEPIGTTLTNVLSATTETVVVVPGNVTSR
jgi:hypothetical protein